MSTCYKLCLFLAILTISEVDSTDQCPAPSPCKCSRRSIYCDDKNLTSIATLIGETDTTYHLLLNNNPSLVITDDSFQNIALYKLDLDNDVNISISDHALKHQRKTLKELSISSAQLNQIPEALMDLDQLQNLSIANNEIQDWNVRVMKKLGVSLTNIDIANTGLTSWPTWLSGMSNLQWLNIQENPIGIIPHNAFNGFHLKLKYLDIRHTGISRMPTSLQTLEELSELYVGGWNFTDSSFYESCLPSKLEKLLIIRTRITKIPNGLNESISLKTLEILESQIEQVDENDLPKYLTSLTIHDSLLTHIDEGVCSLNLTRLSLWNNNIERIEKNDLRDCSNLTYLDLGYNDINYISPFAFDRLTHLRTLWLSGNKFNHIPIALKTLNALDHLYFGYNSLECTCLEYWFIQWRRNNTSLFYLSGRCTNLDITLYAFDQEALKKINDNRSCEEITAYITNTSSVVLLNLTTIIKYLPLYIVLILQSV